MHQKRRNRVSQKRVNIHHCAEVKDWFLDLVAIQRERLGWNYITTFRHAQLVAPNNFRWHERLSAETLEVFR